MLDGSIVLLIIVSVLSCSASINGPCVLTDYHCYLMAELFTMYQEGYISCLLSVLSELTSHFKAVAFHPYYNIVCC